MEAQNENGTISLDCDYVVLAVGAKPNAFDTSLLEEKGFQFML